MAFVSTSPRNFLKEEGSDIPGPGHYVIEKQSHSRDCAPFRSTSPRRVVFEGQMEPVPGPGQYNVGKEIVQPRITAYTNTYNVIIKVNSTGTPQFKSVTHRFPPEKQTLEIIEEDPCFSLRKERKKLPKNPVNRTMMPNFTPTKPSIPTILRGKLNPQSHEIVKLPTVEPGPGDYQTSNKPKATSKATVWGKDKVKRFNDSAIALNGPGSYEVSGQMGSKGQQSSNFKSGTVRTFFDTLMYNSCSGYITQRRKQIDFKSPNPAPGQYSTLPSDFAPQQPKPPKLQFFGSSSKRFGSEGEHQSTSTFYVPNPIGANHSFNQGNPSFNSSSAKAPSFIPTEQSTPGPGEYEDRVEPNRLKVGKRVEKFGSTAQRIPQQKRNEEERRELSQSEMEKEILRSRFGQLQAASSMFKSKTTRICSQNKSITDFNLDLSFHDVAKKVERQRINLENLRKIQVYKPPFQTNSPRFPHYEEWAEQTSKPQAERKEITVKRCGAQPYQTKVDYSKGTMARQQRFPSQRRGGGIPGVGNYDYGDAWRNNSFNCMFKQQ